MGKGQRISVFLTTMLLLGVVYFFFRTEINSLGDKGILVITALVMLSFSLLFSEHYFTKPTDVIASSLSFLILLSPSYPQLERFGWWYWIFWGYNALLLICALTSLLLVNELKAQNDFQNRAARFLKVLVTRLGNAKVLWFSFFALCLFFYVDSQSPVFVVLFCYAALILLIDPKKSSFDLLSVLRDRGNEAARIFGVQSGNSFLAKCVPGATIKRFDFVTFKPKTASGESAQVGLVLDAYSLNDERWLRIVSDESFGHPVAVQDVKHRAGSIYPFAGPENHQGVSRLVGTVSEKSTIEKLRFEYAFQAPVQEGDLLEVESNDLKVLYQVVEGITGTETLESKDEAGLTIGEAIQLGVWNASRRCFDRYGWVPLMNKPVFLACDVEPIDPADTEFEIGKIPGTNLPVFIDRESAVTHHIAVLGVTGSGKSVFSRNLVREIAKDGTKIICVDFTNEYASKLSDLIKGPLISGESAAALFEAVDAIGFEIDKFPNQRDRGLMDRSERMLRDGFKEAIQEFVYGNSPATLFELPDVTNSTGILEYTRWFFRALFDLAKSGSFGNRRICVVLEEAHTIVPEWNFLGIDDKRSSSVVNSIAQIALQGRKYGVGFVVIAQRTANVSKTVLTQCNSVIAFQQFDRTSSDFLGNYMGEGFVASLTRLKPRHAIAVGKAFSSGTPVIFQVPEIAEPIHA